MLGRAPLSAVVYASGAHEPAGLPRAGRQGASLEGGLAAGVPLELKGLWAAHQAYGRAPWASLVSPAAALARSGFPAHPYLINALNESSAKYARAAAPVCTTAAFWVWTPQLLRKMGSCRPPSCVPALTADWKHSSSQVMPLVQDSAHVMRTGYVAAARRLRACEGGRVCQIRLLSLPDFRGVFFKADGAGGWRAPRVNESCCVRTALADLLDAVGAQVAA